MVPPLPKGQEETLDDAKQKAVYRDELIEDLIESYQGRPMPPKTAAKVQEYRAEVIKHRDSKADMRKALARLQKVESQYERTKSAAVQIQSMWA